VGVGMVSGWWRLPGPTSFSHSTPSRRSSVDRERLHRVHRNGVLTARTTPAVLPHRRTARPPDLPRPRPRRHPRLHRCKLILHALHENNLPIVNHGQPVEVIETPTILSLGVIIGVLMVTVIASLTSVKGKAQNAVSAARHHALQYWRSRPTPRSGRRSSPGWPPRSTSSRACGDVPQADTWGGDPHGPAVTSLRRAPPRRLARRGRPSRTRLLTGDPRAVDIAPLLAGPRQARTALLADAD
jgi:hypothetical protein